MREVTIMLRGGGQLNCSMEIPDWLANADETPERVYIQSPSGQETWVWGDAIAAILAGPPPEAKA